MCLFSGLEKVRGSKAEDQEPSEQSTEWQRLRKGYSSYSDFYCDSEGLEDFLGGHTKAHLTV